MNFLLTIRHAITGLEQNFHDHQALSNFLHTVGDDLDNWIGHDAHGELPPPEVAEAPEEAKEDPAPRKRSKSEA